MGSWHHVCPGGRALGSRARPRGVPSPGASSGASSGAAAALAAPESSELSQLGVCSRPLLRPLALCTVAAHHAAPAGAALRGSSCDDESCCARCTGSLIEESWPGLAALGSARPRAGAAGSGAVLGRGDAGVSAGFAGRSPLALCTASSHHALPGAPAFGIHMYVVQQVGT